MDIDKNLLELRMRSYYDQKVDWTEIELLNTGLTREAAGFEPKKVRQKVQMSESYDPQKLVKYSLRPFDTRWCYYSDVSPLWNRSRPTLWTQNQAENFFLVSRPTGVTEPEGVPVYFTTLLGDNDSLRGHAYYFPALIYTSLQKKERDQLTFVPDDPKQITENLSGNATDYLNGLGINEPNQNMKTSSLIWMHALAIGYSPAYLTENADGIRQYWPRIPLPDSADRLRASAALGRQVAALLDTETPVPGVTSGALRPVLRLLGPIAREGGGALDPAADLALTAGWGHAGKGGITMPAKGKTVPRDYTPDERAAILDGAATLGLSPEAAFRHLGETTRDVYLNDTAYWKNVPERVWTYTIGGYQVIKKWLSYRERPLLGRALTSDEAREVMQMARRIAALLLLEPALDANYAAVKENLYPWPGPDSP
ncbi:MAG: hypothetical protein KY468_18660 [Armatimonadetes bacterium]|nr:hypothetical protein [Armatimonadota bacterium]